MKRVLFFGSDDFQWTRPVNRVFLDLRPETHLLDFDGGSPAGHIAARTGEALFYKVREVDLGNMIDYQIWPEGGEPQYSEIYGFYYADELNYRASNPWMLKLGRRLHLFVSRRPGQRSGQAAQDAGSIPDSV